jgi:hypothetical protein
MSTEPRLHHLDEDALIRYQLGDDEEGREKTREHLASCEACRDALEQISDVLAMVSSSALPEPPEGFERVMWARVSARLDPPRTSGWASWLTWPRLVMAGGALAVVIAAFVAGRWTSEPVPGAPVEVLVKLAPESALQLATSDHLERAQMMLAEVLHSDAGDPALSAEQSRAADLVSASRLIRQSVSQSGDIGMADVLEDLERVLVEIANRADGWSPDELEAFKARLDEGGMWFRLRVVSAEMRQRQERRPPTT